MADEVSREARGTSSPAPKAAHHVFPPGRLGLAERFAEWLAGDGVLRGLIGPRESPRLWERHLLNCAVLGEVVREGATVCDLGSGAGLPGLALAIARPDVQVTLVEPLLRRTSFLEQVVTDLGLDQVEVVRGRAQDLHGGSRYDVVTARALAPLAKLLRWSMPLVGPAGALVAMKGSSVRAEVEAASEDLRLLRCGQPEVLTLGVAVVNPPTTAVRVAWADPARVG